MPSKSKSLKKGNIAIYIILLLVVIGAMAALRRCAGNGSLTQKTANDTLNIAIEYSPLSLYTYDDTLGGFCYDLMRLIEIHSKHKFVFHPIVTLESTLDRLDKGAFDMVIAQFPTTKDDKNKYLFSEALYLDRQVLIQLKDSTGHAPIKTQLDIAGDTVFIIKGSSMRSRLSNLSHEIGDTIYIAEDGNYGPEQLFLRVATGEIKYAVINESTAARMSKDYPNVDYNTEISFTQFQSVILGKDEAALCDSLNNWIKSTKESKEYKSLLSRYF